jgi:hypothetical protein
VTPANISLLDVWVEIFRENDDVDKHLIYCIN